MIFVCFGVKCDKNKTEHITTSIRIERWTWQMNESDWLKIVETVDGHVTYEHYETCFLSLFLSAYITTLKYFLSEFRSNYDVIVSNINANHEHVDKNKLY